nr:uncharacterized protein LOC123768712 [Procambarus clarkii]
MRVGGGACPCAWLAVATLIGTAGLSWAATSTGDHLELLDVLTELEATLRETEGCEGRVEQLWEAVRVRNALLDDMKAKVLQRMDQIAVIKKADRVPVEDCEDSFTRVGNSCYHTYSDHLRVWWRARFHCWILGSDLVHPEDLHSLRNYVPEAGDTKYWIGARTVTSGDVPEWWWVDGERIDTKDDNYTSLTQHPQSHKCAMLDTFTFQLEATDCEDPHGVTLCEVKMYSN